MTDTRTLTGLKAVLFDFDGVLLDSAADIAASVNKALAHFGYGAVPEDKIRTFVGDGAKKLIERALRFSLFGLGKHDRTPVPDFTAMLGWYVAYYRDHAVVYSTLYPGVEKMLDTLKKNGLYMGIVSNKPFPVTQTILEHFGISVFFDAVVGPEMITHIKPDPEGILLALKKLNETADEAGTRGEPRTAVLPAQTLMVGDSATDIQAGRRAGTYTCAVTGGLGSVEELLAENADIVVGQTEKLISAIL